MTAIERNLIIRMNFQKLMVIATIFTIFISGCQSMRPHETAIKEITELGPIIDKIHPEESVAVSWIYNAENGNITALGNIWRDRVAMGLKDHNIRIKGRKDVVLLIDDIESFGSGKVEKDIWEKAGADIVVTGTYRIICNNGVPEKFLLYIKALRVEDAELIGSCEWSENLGPDWRPLALNIRGNVYHKKLQTITAPENIKKQPSLSARLNSSNGSYMTGEKGQIYIQTDPGMYLYLFSLSADNTITLLYPNRYCKDAPIAGKEFVFPKDCSKDIDLEFYPLIPGKRCRESVLVVASIEKLDFSFIPFQTHQIYHWVKGEDIKKIYDVLHQTKCWRKLSLDYTVGPGPEK